VSAPTKVESTPTPAMGMPTTVRSAAVESAAPVRTTATMGTTAAVTASPVMWTERRVRLANASEGQRYDGCKHEP